MLQIKDIHKKYKTGTLVQKALDGVSLSFRENEFVAVLGPSGSGKTTLLNIIGGLDHCDSGELLIDSVPTSRYKSRDWDSYRNHSVGFIFQSYNLIPHQTLLSNVELAMTLSGVRKKERRAAAEKELERVGLREQMHKKPSQLSGGQMQRVAIARALVNHPTIVLADEPTGALDSETGIQVMELLREVAQDHLVVMVTHNPELARQYATRIISLKDGRVTDDTDPYVPAEESTSLPDAGGKKKRRKPSMSFLTALSLSVSNLLSKKTRTLLVAFAASIGITGIALILSLSTGAHSYINNREQEALSEYPLQISSSSFSMEASMMAFAQMNASASDGAADTDAAGSSGNKDSSGSSADGGSSDSASGSMPQTVKERQFLGGLFSGASTNDLASLKKWFDSGKSGIENYTRDISYSYGLSPQIYRDDPARGWTQVNPDQTMAAMGISTSDNLSSMMSVWNSNDAFVMLPKNPDIYESSYTLLAGHWPEEINDCVLVLFPGGAVPDFLLYTMGMKDSAELESMISNVMTGEPADTSLSASAVYDPEDFLGIEFSLLPACRRFSYDEKLGVWLDQADNREAMNSLLENGEKLVISGVVMASDDSPGILSYGIDYLPGLMEKIIKEAEQSDVVKAQLAAPETDILTGAPFGSDAGSSLEGMSDMIEVHPEKIPDAISLNWKRLPYILDQHLDISVRTTFRILKELLLTGSSPTLKKINEELLPALFELIDVDEDKLSGVISMEMDEQRMQELYSARSSSAQATLSGNLNRFGYADLESPDMIQIYPNDFESKDEVIKILDDYNTAMEKEGSPEKVISYTDYVGSLMSSVTSIIDVITYVLIAFVAVSLIVSSIMIGIITYISVLERRKEIGILRAMGASRHNIRQVFNAETFIIGILSGFFGIGLTLLAQIPINAAIRSYTDEPVRAYLPVNSALLLILLCIILNLIGGSIPAGKASRQDPVTALRSE